MDGVAVLQFVDVGDDARLFGEDFLFDDRFERAVAFERKFLGHQKQRDQPAEQDGNHGERLGQVSQRDDRAALADETPQRHQEQDCDVRSRWPAPARCGRGRLRRGVACPERALVR